MTKVCIDPGHGGYDPGCTRGTVLEKDITLKIGLQLRDLLQRAGFSVVMTRESDASPGGYREVNADLNERCRISDAAQADVFLSIHVNAGGGQGAEIFVYQDGGTIRTLAQKIVDATAGIIGGYHGKPIKATYEAPQGGIRVVDATDAPAMLLEIGYIDSDDLPKIQANIDKFAPVIAKAFCEFYNMPVQEDEYMMKPEDANKIIAFLKAAYGIKPDPEFGRLADELRKASGQPTQNS